MALLDTIDHYSGMKVDCNCLNGRASYMVFAKGVRRGGGGGKRKD